MDTRPERIAGIAKGIAKNANYLANIAHYDLFNEEENKVIAEKLLEIVKIQEWINNNIINLEP